MIGVVVWSSGSREKAIIWCEDQASLAYLQGRTNVAGSVDWLQPGDLVELETQMVGNLRHALNVTLLSERACPDLPQILADGAPAKPASPRPALRVVAQQDLPHAGGAQLASPPSPKGWAQPRSGAAR